MQVFDRALRAAISPIMRRAITGRARSPSHPEMGRLTLSEASTIVRRAWREAAAESERLPREPTYGSRILVRSACLTLMTYRSLVAAGVSPDAARQIVADITSRCYRPVTRLSAWTTGLGRRSPEDVLSAQVRSQYRFPFNDPGWKHVIVGSHGYDVVHCPLADYFVSHGAADLCTSAFCNQDFRAAEMWGGRLTRTGTLAEGADACDFRYELAGRD